MSSSDSFEYVSHELGNVKDAAYRNLQVWAQSHGLPGTFKRDVMVAMIQAQIAGDDDLVRKIVEENRRVRAPKPTGAPGIGKHEKTRATAPAATTATAGAKRRGPGRPRSATHVAADRVAEKRAKSSHALSASDQMVVSAKVAKGVRVSTANRPKQLHSTQPLLRALLATSPSLEYPDRSFVRSTETPRQVNIDDQANVFFQSRMQSLPPPDPACISMYRNVQNVAYQDRNPRYQMGFPPNAHDSLSISRICHSVATLSRENFQQHSRPHSLYSRRQDEMQGGNPNNLNPYRSMSSSETIIPEMVGYELMYDAPPEPPRQQSVLFPLRYNQQSTMNTSDGSFLGQEAWNRTKRFELADFQEKSAPRNLSSLKRGNLGFKDSGGFIIRNGLEKMTRSSDNHVFDLSVPKSQAGLGPFPHPPAIGNHHISAHTPDRHFGVNFQEPFLGSPNDVAFTQTRNRLTNQPDQVTFGAEGQTYAALVNVRPPPVYQSPRPRQQPTVGDLQRPTRCLPVTVEMMPPEKVPQSLEYLWNYKRVATRDVNAKGISMCEKPNTLTTDFYRFPLISSRFYVTCSGSEATESSPEDNDFFEGETTAGSRPMADAEQLNATSADYTSWAASQMESAERRERNQPQLPMKYHFLDFPDSQIADQLQDSSALLYASGDCSKHNAPKATSTPTEVIQQPLLMDLGLPHPFGHRSVEYCPSSPITSRPPSPTIDVGRPGRPANGGCDPAFCNQMCPASQHALHDHDRLLMLQCPMDGCIWCGCAGQLADHIFDVNGHKHEIVCSDKNTYSFVLDLVNFKNIHYLQECFARLFVVTVVSSISQVYVFLQEIATNSGGGLHRENARGYLEIAGKDGYPFSWNGQIAQIHEPLERILLAGQCLSIPVLDIAPDADNYVSLYDMVTI